MMNIYISIGSIFMVGLIGFYFYCFEQLKELLKLKYKEDYEAMGKPTLFMNSTVKNNLSFQKYLSSKQYEIHNDKQLNEMCKTVYVTLKIGHVLVGAVILFFIFDALQIIK